MTAPLLSREAWLAAAAAAERAVLRLVEAGRAIESAWLQRRARQMRERAEVAS